MNRKTEQLEVFSSVNTDQYVDLFKETLHVRRQYTRENSTSDVIEKFTGYSFPLMVRSVASRLTFVEIGSLTI
jgi:hypothetical protein